MAPTIITVGDPERVDWITRHFDDIEVKKEAREFVTHTGRIGKKRLTVISTGIGTDNIDIVFNELHALFNLDLASGQAKADFTRLDFIRIGTSGAVRPEVPIDSLLASETALGYDGLLHFYKGSEHREKVNQFLEDYPELQDLPKPYESNVSDGLKEHFSSVNNISGVTITAPGFYAPQGRSVSLPAKLPNFIETLSKAEFAGRPITNIEMETAGIYGLSQLLGHRALSLSAILANRYTGEFSNQPAKTIETLIEKTLEKVIELR